MGESDSMALNRVERLLGTEVLDKIERVNVIIFGIGGVGSWTAEALVRSGVKNLTIVDADKVAASNINRQLMALHSTIGMSKVEVLKSGCLILPPMHMSQLLPGCIMLKSPGNFVCRNMIM